MIQPADRKITDILKAELFTLSAEIIPPRNGSDRSLILGQIESLTKSGAQFLAVTKGAGGSLRGGSLPIVQTVKEGFNTPVIAHFTCRDLLPEEVENQMIDHHLFGIRNILALRGDPPQGVAGWQPRDGSYPYAYQLIEQLRELNSGNYLERKGFNGSSSKERTDFCIGAACYPDSENPAERLDYYQQKVDAGAEYAITQMLFDSDSYGRFLDETSKRGAHIPVLPGTRLVSSQEQALRMAKRFGIKVQKSFLDRLPEKDSEAHPDRTLSAFMTFTEELRAKGACGLHVFVLTDTEIASIVLKKLAGK
jgi:methylenetetrahydrofolate reductase (NADPH)